MQALTLAGLAQGSRDVHAWEAGCTPQGQRRGGGEGYQRVFMGGCKAARGLLVAFGPRVEGMESRDGKGQPSQGKAFGRPVPYDAIDRGGSPHNRRARTGHNVGGSLPLWGKRTQCRGEAGVRAVQATCTCFDGGAHI